jgi:hypothetical protein
VTVPCESRNESIDRNWWREQGADACIDRMVLMNVELERLRKLELLATRSESPKQELPQMPTEEMADAVRGILQVIRNKHGATFPEVLEHCENRGDDTTFWPPWVQDAEGYVTEQGAAMMIYEVMSLARYRQSKA